MDFGKIIFQLYYKNYKKNMKNKINITKNKALERIYKEMANKDLKYWCIVKDKKNWEEKVVLWVDIDFEENSKVIFLKEGEKLKRYIFKEEDFEIIWNPVYISRILEWLDYTPIKWWDTDKLLELLDSFNDFDNPIELQPKECINFIIKEILDNIYEEKN